MSKLEKLEEKLLKTQIAQAKDVWSVEDIALVYGRNTNNFYSIVNNSDFPKGHMIGKTRYWKKEDVRRWFDRLEAA